MSTLNYKKLGFWKFLENNGAEIYERVYNLAYRCVCNINFYCFLFFLFIWMKVSTNTQLKTLNSQKYWLKYCSCIYILWLLNLIEFHSFHKILNYKSKKLNKNMLCQSKLFWIMFIILCECDLYWWHIFVQF